MNRRWSASGSQVPQKLVVLRHSTQLDVCRRQNVGRKQHKVVIAAAADGSFDYVGIGVRDTGMVAVARESPNAIQV